ncbi:MAG TPA: cobalamin-dependent protein [Thermoleophilia bacterium]|nr:cobalamin-dependent protein [Thermoleophilia bacterium]
MHPLAQALCDLDEPSVNRLLDEELEEGSSALELVKHLNEGMVAVGRLFAEEEYFISQLIFSAEILKGVMNRLEPLLLEGEEAERGGRVVIGTVKGDIHDIGKNIVATLLRGSGFDVVDLGVDVPAERFVEAVREGEAKALCLSALLNVTYPEMKKVVDTFAGHGLRDQVTIVIGGAPINEQVREFSGADFYGPDAVAGVELCKKIYG